MFFILKIGMHQGICCSDNVRFCKKKKLPNILSAQHDAWNSEIQLV